MTTPSISPIRRSRATTRQIAAAVFALVLAGCGTGTAGSPATSAGPSTTATTPAPAPSLALQGEAGRIDAVVGEFVQNSGFSGAVLVARDGKVVISKGYGMADRQAKTPVTPHTHFRIASITKSFTAIAALQLQQQGKLDVQDKICDFLPACPEAWKPITIHHLLTHTSGIEDLDAGSDPSPLKLVTVAQAQPLASKPGAEFHYSSAGYIVLTAVLEKISGGSYADLIQKGILDPAGMRDTGVYSGPSDVAMGYSGDSSASENMAPTAGAASLYSSAEDLYRWDQALDGEQLLSTDLKGKLFTAVSDVPIPATAELGPFRYGYGWVVYKLLGHEVLGNGGVTTGVRAEFDRLPGDKVTIIFLSNQDATDTDAMLVGVGRIVLGES